MDERKLQYAKRRSKLPQIIAGSLERARHIELPTLAAAVSYYSMLASIPLLAVLLTLATRLLPRLNPLDQSAEGIGIGQLTGQQLKESLAMLLPPQAAQILSQEIGRIQQDPPVALLSVGVLISLWTTSNAFMAVISAMNKIHSVEETRPIWKVRATAIILPLILSGALIVALFCIVGLPGTINFFPVDDFAGRFIKFGQWVLVYLFVLLAFGFTYRLAPNDTAKQVLITPGSVWAAAIFLAGSIAFQLYVANFGSYQKLYGSLGGAIIFLIWTWLVSACLLFGCVLNKTLDELQPRYGRQTKPNEIPSVR